MKRNILILFILVLILSITGCANEKPVEKVSNLEDGNKVEETSVSPKDSSITPAAIKTDNDKLDSSLTGLELLNSVKYKTPDKLIMNTKVTGLGGMVSETVTYNKGKNSRMETEISGLGKQIVIYNSDEGATYQYTEGQSTGIVMLDGEDEEDMMETEVGMSTPTFADLVDESSEDIIARVEKLGDEEVIYIEAKESEEDMGEVNVYMWYSTKYSIPLKYEMYMNDELMTRSEVTKIETNVDIDDGLFTPPSDIEFTNYSIDDIFDNVNKQ